MNVGLLFTARCKFIPSRGEWFINKSKPTRYELNLNKIGRIVFSKFKADKKVTATKYQIGADIFFSFSKVCIESDRMIVSGRKTIRQNEFPQFYGTTKCTNKAFKKWLIAHVLMTSFKRKYILDYSKKKDWLRSKRCSVSALCSFNFQ